MSGGEYAGITVHSYGKLRIRSSFPSERFRNVVDQVSLCGWHDCNDRYAVHREHPLSEYLLLYTLDGCGWATVGEEKYRLEPGRLMILPKGICHAYGVPKDGRWVFYWMHVKGVNCSMLLDCIAREHGRCPALSCGDQVIDCMEALLCADCRFYEYELFAAQRFSGLLFDVMNDLDRGRQPGRHSALVHKMIEYIELNYSREVTIAELAAQVFHSPEHVIRVFRSETGMTPHQYLRRLRMKRACVYLEESGMSVEEITQLVGYRSASAFIAQFREMFGATPRAYRNMKQKPACGKDEEERA